MKYEKEYIESPMVPDEDELYSMDAIPPPWMWVNLWDKNNKWLKTGIITSGINGIGFHTHNGEIKDGWLWKDVSGDILKWSRHKKQRHMHDLLDALQAQLSARDTEIAKLENAIESWKKDEDLNIEIVAEKDAEIIELKGEVERLRDALQRQKLRG